MFVRDGALSQSRGSAGNECGVEVGKEEGRGHRSGGDEAVRDGAGRGAQPLGLGGQRAWIEVGMDTQSHGARGRGSW